MHRLLVVPQAKPTKHAAASSTADDPSERPTSIRSVASAVASGSDDLVWGQCQVRRRLSTLSGPLLQHMHAPHARASPSCMRPLKRVHMPLRTFLAAMHLPCTTRYTRPPEAYNAHYGWQTNSCCKVWCS